ncbi:MAG: hypothetical protein ABIT38_18645, partial [Gemmatimonadaceae bacterium]
MLHYRLSLPLVAFVAALPVTLAPNVVDAQVMEVRPVTPAASAPATGALRTRQGEFEAFRRDHLPSLSLGRGVNGQCDEHVGRFCYWYDDKEPKAPDEPSSIRAAREVLIAQLDSASREFPSDRWTSGQLVRYLTEADRNDEAVTAANRCDAKGWWCPALRGFALHAAQRFAAADSAWSKSLEAMDQKQRCEWRDVKLMLDDDLLRDYRTMPCGDRDRFERRVWWLSRPMLSSPGNDARSEFFSRRLYTSFLEDAPSVHALGFDDDERELLLRYGWPRAWTTQTVYLPRQGSQKVITGHEPAPAPPMLPTAATVKNPALSDSLGWRGKGLPGVRARYAPEVARRLLPLQQQSAIFRRGDSAFVVMAYDASSDAVLTDAAKAGDLTAALVLTKGEEQDATIVRAAEPNVRGTLSAHTTWGPMLMSAEVASRSKHVLARARYGMRASDTPGARVSISDLLLFEPYDGMPSRLEEALPHARSTLALREGAKVGIYWETYNTNPLGEGMQVAITVAPEEEEKGGFVRRGLLALRLARETQPITVGITDVSARGLGYSPRAVVVDLATL